MAYTRCGTGILQYAVTRLPSPPGIGPMCGREETPFAFLMTPGRSELILVRSLSGFWKKIADGRVAITHRGPRDICDGRWSEGLRAMQLRRAKALAPDRGQPNPARRPRCGLTAALRADI